MNFTDFFQQFQGIATLFASDITVSITRIFLIILGIMLMYLGKKGVLEALLMIPMGLGMATINASLMFLPPGIPGGFLENGAMQGTLFLDSMITDTDQLFTLLQIDFLQPIYVFTFSNGLIACLVFMGIGSLLDIGFLLQRPFTSMLLALCAELGTFVTVPIAQAMGLTAQEAASIAMVGGADGPMVLFTSLSLAKHLFVPITVVAYLYLGLTYGGYPYLIRLLIPKKLRAIKIDKSNEKLKKAISASTKLAAAAILCVVLCLLFPVASPLFFSLFLGIAVKEAKLTHIHEFISGPLLYGSTFFLGLTLGVLCEAHLLLDPRILKLLVLGILALLFSGIGGIGGGYIMYFITKGNFNPTIGIAGVSCVPSTAKVAQKEVTKANPNSMILPEALGANICGVITSAIIAGLYINFFS
ncbi:MAG: sodium ion-translocating decarboxylase subunit beta [Paludibacter sp.]|nr:sodium ion-translocating decarboxylase subunit beta [Paludibacter sp.]MBP7611618.1 sodium ion-translocating decarboxylase subunit beta [Paludibacter sp.]